LTKGAIIECHSVEHALLGHDHTSEEFSSDRDVDNSSSTLNGVTFQDITIIAENHHSDIVFFQVERHAAETAGKDNHLSCLNIGKTIDTGDTISDRNDGTSLSVLDSGIFRPGSSGDLVLEVCGELKSLAG
jgi:hypothetical protein